MKSILRVRKLTDVAFQEPLDAERLYKVMNHSALPFRKREDARLARLEAERLLPWLGSEMGVSPDQVLEELARRMMPQMEEFLDIPRDGRGNREIQ